MTEKLINRRSIDILSKLLAEENINIVHDPRAKTASFYPKERKLVFPTYGDSISTVTQVSLALHETGHATDTPESALGLMKKYGKSVVNILEDVRIEKIVKAKFPGSIKFFTEGYRELVLEHNFFGTANKDNPFDFSGFGFLDRVNVHFKLGAMAMVPFNRAEQKLVDEIDKIETLEDLEKMARKLKELAKENAKTDTHNQTPPPPPQEDGEESDPTEGEGADPNPDFDEDSDDVEIDDESENESGGESGEESESSDEESDSEEGEESESESGEGEGTDSENDEEEGEDSASSGSESDESDEENEEGEASGSSGEDSESDEENGEDSESDENEESGDTGDSGDNEPSSDSDNTDGEHDDSDPVDIDEDDLEESETENTAAEVLERLAESAGTVGKLHKTSEIDYLVQPWTDIEAYVDRVLERGTFQGEWSYPHGYEEISFNENLLKFRKDTKAVLNKMVAEFNRNAAGTVSRRTAYKDTGVLDPNKMVHYRYNENIFKKRKYVRDGKNHGIVLFVDFTASMRGRIKPIMRQVVLMTDFCRKINIPFRVYGWSDRYLPSSTGGQFEPVRNNRIYGRMSYGRSFDGVAYTEILTSDMPEAKIEKFCKWALTGKGMTPGGSTPLVSSMYFAMPIVKKFRQEANVDVMKLMLFTDGEGHTTLPDWNAGSWSDEETGTQYSKKEIDEAFAATDEYYSYRTGDDRQIRFLSEVMKDRYNVETIFMYMNAQSSATKRFKSNQWTPDEVRKATKSMKDMGIAKVGERDSYTFIGIKDGYDIAPAAFELDVADDASHAKMKGAFNKAAKARKGSTLFATLVAESIVE